MKKILMSDNALKVISVILAILIWVYISFVIDPVVEVSVYDLPIQFVGQEALTERGLGIISESATTVSVDVKGSRKKMGNNDMKTIIVKADVSTISQVGTHEIPVEVVIPFENQGISSQNVYKVDVTVEALGEKELDITVDTLGSLAQDYMPGEITTEPKKVKIKGPKSAVEKLGKAVVKLDYNNADVDIDTSLPITFCDEDGKDISQIDALLTRVKLSNEKADVHCSVLKIRKVTPKVNILGGQDISYKVKPDVLYIYGDDQKTAQINEIETEDVSASRLMDSEKVKAKLKIPYGVKVLYDITEVEISVDK